MTPSTMDLSTSTTFTTQSSLLEGSAIQEASFPGEPAAPMDESREQQSVMQQDIKSPTVEDLVEELNFKNNQIHAMIDENLQLTQEEIQQTLSANMPSSNHLTQNEAAGSNNALDSMDTLRSNMISPQSSDLNFDAFDILDLPDFDSENLGSDMSQSEASLSSTSLTPVTSTAPVMTVSSSSASHDCVSCLNGQKSSSSDKPGPRAGIANITDFSPEWSYPEGGVKILVTGPWYSTTSPYTVLFGDISVQATLVQSGVLRCFSPG